MKSVLIADPNPAARKAMALLLTRKLGVGSVYEVDNTDTLIEQISDSPPDIILLTDSLPGHVSPATCSRLREIYPNIRIVLLSVDENARELASACHAEFIYKGASLKDILAQFERLFKDVK